MLVRSTKARLILHTITLILFFGLFVMPLLIVLVGAFATSWSGILPSGLTLANFLAIFTESATLATMTASLVTAVVSTVLALIIAVWAALASRKNRVIRSVMDTVFILPIAVPSVAIGLGVLIAFSRQPFAINGTVWIVLIAHTVLVVALAYQPIAAAVTRMDEAFEEMAAALGAGPVRILWHVILPLLRPAIIGAAALCVALSMGELTAMLMVAPPDWRTMPLQIFSFTSRGIRLYEGAALAVVMLLITLSALTLLQRSSRRRVATSPDR